MNPTDRGVDAPLVPVQRRPLKPGEIFGLILIAEALILDDWLVKRGHETISTCTRSVMVGKILALYFAVHLTQSFAFDPLSMLSRWRTNRLMSNSQLLT